jgi:uncharacterized RDD family membrane protein YckC
MENKFVYAKVKSRGAAYLFDYLVNLSFILIVFIPLSADKLIAFIRTRELLLDFQTVVSLYRFSFIAALFSCGYFIVIPHFLDGQTFGKRIFGIKIVNVNGEKAQLIQIVVREIFGKLVLSFGSFFVSNFITFLLMLYRKDNRGIEDILANTIVIEVARFNRRKINYVDTPQ